MPLNVTGHHLSIQEVDHEKQTFAASVWVSHLAVTSPVWVEDVFLLSDHEKQTFAASVWVSHPAVICLG